MIRKGNSIVNRKSSIVNQSGLRDDLLEVFEAMLEAQLRAVRRLRQSQKPKADSWKKRRVSHIDMVYGILQSARRPLHISEILELISKRYGMSLDRESVVSALAKRVARKDRFTRTAANTFSLLP